MKILFVEDNAEFIQEFLKQLSVLGEVVVFKSSNAARKWLHFNEEPIDLVVCDHNILRFEEEPDTRAFGTEVYHDLRGYNGSSVPFIHFSYDPCPEEYKTNGDANFHSLRKQSGVNLLKFIQEKGLRK